MRSARTWASAAFFDARADFGGIREERRLTVVRSTRDATIEATRRAESLDQLCAERSCTSPEGWSLQARHPMPRGVCVSLLRRLLACSARSSPRQSALYRCEQRHASHGAFRPREPRSTSRAAPAGRENTLLTQRDRPARSCTMSRTRCAAFAGSSYSQTRKLTQPASARRWSVSRSRRRLVSTLSVQNTASAAATV